MDMSRNFGIRTAVVVLLGLACAAVFFLRDATPNAVDGEKHQAHTQASGEVEGSSKDIALESGAKPARGAKPHSRRSDLDFYDVQFAALRGDARAQRLLSELYGMCLSYSLSPARYLQTLAGLAAAEPQSAAYIDGMKARRARVCAGVDGGAPIPNEAHQLWLEQAAAAGDAAAIIRLKSRSPELLDADGYRDMIDLAIGSHEPAALFELGSLLARAPADASLGNYEGLAGPVASHAMELAACRRGLDCRAGSAIMDSLCENTGACWYPDYESFVFAELVPRGSWKRVTRGMSLLDDQLAED